MFWSYYATLHSSSSDENSVSSTSSPALGTVRPSFSPIHSFCVEIWRGLLSKVAWVSFPVLICHWCFFLCNVTVHGVSLLYIWDVSFCYWFVDIPYKFWEHYRSLVQLEWILRECWWVRINFFVIYLFSFFIFNILIIFLLLNTSIHWELNFTENSLLLPVL